MENMIVLPQLEERLRLPKLMEEIFPEFEAALSYSIKGQYTHPKYANDWVMAIRVEARQLTHAGYTFLQDTYQDRAVHSTVIIVHLCDLLKDDAEKGEEAMADFEETVSTLRDAIRQRYGWVDVRPTSLLSVNRYGFGRQVIPELPEMHPMRESQNAESPYSTLSISSDRDSVPRPPTEEEPQHE